MTVKGTERAATYASSRLSARHGITFDQAYSLKSGDEIEIDSTKGAQLIADGVAVAVVDEVVLNGE